MVKVLMGGISDEVCSVLLIACGRRRIFIVGW